MRAGFSGYSGDCRGRDRDYVAAGDVRGDASTGDAAGTEDGRDTVAVSGTGSAANVSGDGADAGEGAGAAGAPVAGPEGLSANDELRAIVAAMSAEDRAAMRAALDDATGAA